MSSKRGSKGRAAVKVGAGLLAMTAFIFLPLLLMLALVADSAAVAAVIVPLWIVMVILMIAGPEGREEVQRIVERPFDERERAIRTRALIVGLAMMTLLNLAWIISGVSGAAAPLAAILFSGAAIVLAIDIARRRTLGGPLPSLEEEHEALVAAEDLGRPTWLATITAWFLATITAGLLGLFLQYGLTKLAVPSFVTHADSANEQFGAIGIAADVAAVVLVLALAAFSALVISLVASRWVNRGVSFAWIFGYQAVTQLTVAAFFGGAFYLNETRGTIGFLIATIVMLLVLRYLACGPSMPTGVPERLRLSRSGLALVVGVTLAALLLVAGFGTTHPLETDLADTTDESATGRVVGDGGGQLTPNSQGTEKIAFGFNNRGPAGLDSARVTGIDSDPSGIVGLVSPAPNRAIPAGDSVWLPTKLSFACADRATLRAKVKGIEVSYTTLGRRWNTTVPTDNLVVSCPKRVAP